MELSLDYTCRQCGGLVTLRVAEITPMKRPACPACGGPIDLSPDALQKLRSALDALARP